METIVRSCTVRGCKYHTPVGGGACTLEQIDVGSDWKCNQFAHIPRVGILTLGELQLIKTCVYAVQDDRTLPHGSDKKLGDILQKLHKLVIK